MSAFRTVHYKVHLPKNENRPEHSFSAVLLSDLHDCIPGEDMEGLLRGIRSQDPEFILSSGDLLTAGNGMNRSANASSVLRSLTERYPVIAVNGNHEQRMKNNRELYGDAYEQYTDLIRSYGVRVLENSFEDFTVSHMHLRIWGYEIPPVYYRKGRHPILSSEEISGTLGDPEPGFFHILLAHHPGYFPAYAKWGADLTLAGHYHGGMVRFPILGGVISPQFRLFPSYSRGSFMEQEKQMIVSSGLGWHTLPLRINNPPELVVLDFPGKDSEPESLNTDHGRK